MTKGRLLTANILGFEVGCKSLVTVVSPSSFYLFSVLGKGQAKMSFKLQAVDM